MRGFERFVAGGISMGAAVALHLAVRHPERVLGLVLARPAWLFGAAPGNMQPYAEVAELLGRLEPAEAKAHFAAGPTARRLAREAPDNLGSLLGFFDRPDPALTADLLGDIAADGPGVSQAEAARLRIPILVIGHGVDCVHPLALAQALAEAIPGARLATIPPKATDRAGHLAAFRAALAQFLRGFEPQDPDPSNIEAPHDRIAPSGP